MKYNSLVVGKGKGSAGDVTASTWRGVKYLKQKATQVRQPNTAGQQNQKAAFALCVVYMRLLLTAIQSSFNKLAVKKSQANVFMQKNMATGFTASGDIAVCNPASMIVSDGTLSGAASVTKDTPSGRSIKISWINNAFGQNNDADDLVRLVAVNSVGEAYSFNNGVVRADASDTIVIPGSTSMASFSYYLYFTTADASNASESQLAV